MTIQTNSVSNSGSKMKIDLSSKFKGQNLINNGPVKASYAMPEIKS